MREPARLSSGDAEHVADGSRRAGPFHDSIAVTINDHFRVPFKIIL